MGVPRWLNIVKMIAPMIVAVAVPGIGPQLAEQIADGIAEAEQLPGASGADKKAHVLNLVRDGIAGANLATGKHAVSPDAVADAVGQGIDTAVAVVDLIHAAHGAAGTGAVDGAAAVEAAAGGESLPAGHAGN